MDTVFSREVIIATVWTEYGITSPSFVSGDHLPLFLIIGDTFEWYAEPSGTRELTTDKVLLPIKFYLDNNLSKLSAFITASYGTITLKIIQGAKVVTTNTTVTTEEDIELFIDIKDKGFTTGDALLELIARGSFNVKVKQIIGFHLTGGWTEYESSETSWTEYEVS